MNCNACREEIEASIDVNAISAVANAHLNSCEACRAFRDEHTALKRMIGSLEVVTAPADFDFRLRARLATLRGERRSTVFFGRFAPSPRFLAITATVIIMFVIGLAVRQSLLSPTSPNNPEQVVKKEIAPPATVSPSPKESEPGEVVARAPQRDRVVPKVRDRNDARKRNNTSTRDQSLSSTQDDVIKSVDMSSTSTANSVLPPGIPDPMSLSTSTIGIPVRTSIKPTTIALEADGVTPKTISVRPVTFGGQDLFEMDSSKKSIVPTVQGVW